MNKKVASEIAVGVILLITVIVGGVFWMQSKKQAVVSNAKQPVVQVPIVQKEEQQVKPSVEATNLQTYRNDTFGFEMSYPKYLNIDLGDYTDATMYDKEDLKNIQKSLDGDLLLAASFSTVQPLDESGNPTYAEGLSFSLNIRKTKYAETSAWFANWKKEYETPSNYEGSPIHLTVKSSQNIKIQDIPAIKFFLGLSSPFHDTCEAVVKNNLVYNFCYNGLVNDKEKLDAMVSTSKDSGNVYDEKKLEEYRIRYRKVLDDIISSFKFTK